MYTNAHNDVNGRRDVPGDKPVWFITGSSRGLGRSLASAVLARGYRCVAAARNVGDVSDLASRYPRTALALTLDVTNPTQRGQALAAAHATFGGIDVLVNNAGIGYNAAVEEGEDEVVRATFEANFFALAALVRAVLPGMRLRSSGHVINISSSGGVTGTVGGGYYSATKFAVEGLRQALAKEVEPLGLRVTLVEPGPFRTDFQGISMTTTRAPLAAYAATAGARRTQLHELSGRQAGDPERAAEAIIAAYESKSPPLHLALGAIAYQRIHAKLTDHLAELEAWKSVTLAADFASS
jgi:NAD(P)-dependent dehydrogenase (short-subunit alcohol dehydrogenase family)